MYTLQYVCWTEISGTYSFHTSHGRRNIPLHTHLPMTVSSLLTNKQPSLLITSLFKKFWIPPVMSVVGVLVVWVSKHCIVSVFGLQFACHTGTIHVECVNAMLNFLSQVFYQIFLRWFLLILLLYFHQNVAGVIHFQHTVIVWKHCTTEMRR